MEKLRRALSPPLRLKRRVLARLRRLRFGLIHFPCGHADSEMPHLGLCGDTRAAGSAHRTWKENVGSVTDVGLLLRRHVRLSNMKHCDLHG